MQTISLYFQVHQPFRYRNYRFFEIGNDHYYYDDYQNESILLKVAEKCYLPANQIMLDLIKKYDGKFKLSFSISGVALDQFELYAPEVIESFKKLAETGHVEFLSETYSHSLVALKNKEEFRRQVENHRNKIKELFKVEPKVFRNTELIYSDEIGNMVSEMGYTGMLTEGAKHVLGWKSPNYVYTNAINPKLKVLLKNFKLSDDIAFRFSNPSWSEYPLTTEKFVGWLKHIDKKEEVINLFMDYETFGEHQWAETGIFEFLKALPGAVFANSKIGFSTPSEIFENHQPVGAVNVPNPISWADEERDLTAWLGNPLQEQAFNKLYSLLDKVRKINDPKLNKDYDYLQVSDHFYYMATKFLSDGDVHSYFNPYNSPYEAFINYMNVLSDFEIRLNAIIPVSGAEELVRMNKIINEKDELIEKFKEELKSIKAKTGKSVAAKPAAPVRTKTVKKTTDKSTSTKVKKTAKPVSARKPSAKK
ncbi:MAG: glycoside hydrolase family 57 protein [Bacteroidales bacterium]|nr:glycoside hydrolase family 57 protein [Bacteroidales bacterium]MCF8390885.1 glycoside hydrolase family 57 protein [Bacteroidales bacterium]